MSVRALDSVWSTASRGSDSLCGKLLLQLAKHQESSVVSLHSACAAAAMSAEPWSACLCCAGLLCGQGRR